MITSVYLSQSRRAGINTPTAPAPSETRRRRLPHGRPDGSDRCVATGDSGLAASFRKRPTRTRAAFSLFALEPDLESDPEHGVAGERAADIA